MPSDRIKEAGNRASRYCAVGERSPKQVLEKLQKYGLSYTEAIDVLEDLRKSNFINEERFSSAFSNDKFRFNGWGKIKIQMELKLHQIPEKEIEIGLQNIDDQEYKEKIESLASRKLTALDKEQNYLVKKNKAAKYLINKGFESALVFRIVEQIMSSREH